MKILINNDYTLQKEDLNIINKNFDKFKKNSNHDLSSQVVFMNYFSKFDFLTEFYKCYFMCKIVFN